MRYGPVAAFIVALSFGGMAIAHTIEADAPVVAKVDRGVLEDHAIALNTEVEALQVKLSEAIARSNGDTAKAEAEMEVHLRAFQPSLDAFVVTYQRFYDFMIERAPNDEARLVLAAERDESLPSIRNMPAALREHALNPPAQSITEPN